MKDYYALLSIKPDATAAQIEAAYRRSMQRHHPNARSSPQALDRMRDLNEAWRVLSEPGQRAAYDRARRDGTLYQPPAPPPSLRAVPPSNFSEFGARRAKGGTCVVTVGVALVLLFALGILGWGLDEQLNFAAIVERAVGEVNALLPTRGAEDAAVALNEVTPTPDPRCRDGL